MKFYQTLQYLSADVVAGAVCSACIPIALLQLDMPLIWWLILPASVFCIYTLDHLLDAIRLKEKASTGRHLFHYHYFKSIAFVWGCSFLFCVIGGLWLLPLPIVIFGFVMGGFVLLHLLLVWLIGSRVSFLFVKELGVGGIYAAGVWGGPLSMMWDELSFGIVLCFTQFFLLAMMNLLIFSKYEAPTDLQDGHTSFVLAIGEKNTQILINLMGLMVLILSVILLYDASLACILPVQFVHLSMLAVLWGISLLPSYFQSQEKYRTWGDGIFLLGVVLCLC